MPNDFSPDEKCANAGFWFGVAALAYPFFFTSPVCAGVAFALGVLGFNSRNRAGAVVGIVLAAAALAVPLYFR